MPDNEDKNRDETEEKETHNQGESNDAPLDPRERFVWKDDDITITPPDDQNK